MNSNTRFLNSELAAARKEIDYLRNHVKNLERELREKEVTISCKKEQISEQEEIIAEQVEPSQTPDNHLKLKPIGMTIAVSTPKENSLIEGFTKATGTLTFTKSFNVTFKKMLPKLQQSPYLWIFFSSLTNVSNSTTSKWRTTLDLRLIKVTQVTEDCKLNFEGINMPSETNIFTAIPHVLDYHDLTQMEKLLCDLESGVEFSSDDMYMPEISLTVSEHDPLGPAKKPKLSNSLQNGVGRRDNAHKSVEIKRVESIKVENPLAKENNLNREKNDEPSIKQEVVYESSLDSEEDEDSLNEYFTDSEDAESILPSTNENSLQDSSSAMENNSVESYPQGYPPELMVKQEPQQLDNLFKCNLCDEGFSNPYILNIHMRAHNSEKDLTCEICQKSFIKQDSLIVHMRVHTGERPFRCSICARDYTSYGCLVRHMKCHAAKKEFKSALLKGHIRCPICTKGFLEAHALQVHMRVHTGERPYKCTYCENGYTSYRCLIRHLYKAHNVEKPKRKFDNFAVSLDGSKRIKPYHCHICRKRFVEETSLSVHMRIHTGERPHKCAICLRDYTSGGCLIRHMLKVHKIDKAVIKNDVATGNINPELIQNAEIKQENVKPFKCHICKREFDKEPTLEYHMRIHTGERPFQCPICSRDYTLHTCLNRHMLKSHGIKSNEIIITTAENENTHDVHENIGEEVIVA